MGSRPDEVNFEIYQLLLAALGPGVHSASNRNEYQKHKNNNVHKADNLIAISEPII
jgi:hypothetical protein